MDQKHPLHDVRETLPPPLEELSSGCFEGNAERCETSRRSAGSRLPQDTVESIMVDLLSEWCPEWKMRREERESKTGTSSTGEWSQWAEPQERLTPEDWRHLGARLSMASVMQGALENDPEPGEKATAVMPQANQSGT
ncbi:hypothetical protein IAR55_004771 [Kwoniella newhampshirensis]|uniref:Rrn9 domain-containing protein n=1 Tax=Kwoniella newhampshirensis TaxID=1651941 RepID=A0AAW0YMU7_9TREE